MDGERSERWAEHREHCVIYQRNQEVFIRIFDAVYLACLNRGRDWELPACLLRDPVHRPELGGWDVDAICLDGEAWRFWLLNEHVFRTDRLDDIKHWPHPFE